MEISSLFKRRAINRRLMVKWKCLLRLWAEQAGSSQVWQLGVGGEVLGAAGLVGTAGPCGIRKGRQGSLSGVGEKRSMQQAEKTTCF